VTCFVLALPEVGKACRGTKGRGSIGRKPARAMEHTTRAWLATHRLDRYADAFEEEGYDDVVYLLHADEEELADLFDTAAVKRPHAKEISRQLHARRRELAATVFAIAGIGGEAAVPVPATSLASTVPAVSLEQVRSALILHFQGLSDTEGVAVAMEATDIADLVACAKDEGVALPMDCAATTPSGRTVVAGVGKDAVTAEAEPVASTPPPLPSSMVTGERIPHQTVITRLHGVRPELVGGVLGVEPEPDDSAPVGPRQEMLARKQQRQAAEQREHESRLAAARKARADSPTHHYVAWTV
jgi:hypothetical protein